MPEMKTVHVTFSIHCADDESFVFPIYFNHSLTEEDVINALYNKLRRERRIEEMTVLPRLDVEHLKGDELKNALADRHEAAFKLLNLRQIRYYVEGCAPTTSFL